MDGQNGFGETIRVHGLRKEKSTYYVQTFADAALESAHAARQTGLLSVVGDDRLALRGASGPAAAAN